MVKKISEDVLEDVRACVLDNKKSDSCINKVLEENGLDESDKSRVLEKILREEID